MHNTCAGLRVTSRTQQMRIPKEGSLPLVEKEDARIMERKENGQKDNYKPGTEAFSMLKCNSSVSVRHGHIATPNYPQAYSANQQCDYHIVLPDQQSRIQFRFLHLGLERGHDWIKIDAGNYQEMFTGSDLPSSLIVTSQNTATLSFHR
jgi:CUB domain